MSDQWTLDMANKLAEECLKVQEKTGEDRLFMEVGEALGASSQTLEEAFLTAIRTRMAELKGRAFLASKLKAHLAKDASE